MDGLQLLTIIFGVAGMAGGAAGWFAKSRGDTIIELQGKEIAYWKDHSAELEKTNTALLTERDALTRENNRLWEKAQGSDQLAKLAQQIKRLVEKIEKR